MNPSCADSLGSLDGWVEQRLRVTPGPSSIAAISAAFPGGCPEAILTGGGLPTKARASSRLKSSLSHRVAMRDSTASPETALR
ncbi:MAG TPA: hypothetical protein P5266_07885 [Candidatus Fermentibacter sp.]|nr:hypothetical protein [Candidatus Fermentibacter sp.]